MNQETQSTTLPENPIQLASALTSKTIRYTNENESSVTEDRERTFKVISVEDVLISKASGNKYIKGYFADVDDGGSVKPRALTVDRISIVV